jgi:ABC-type taurine transport system ATPase subunit
MVMAVEVKSEPLVALLCISVTGRTMFNSLKAGLQEPSKFL